MFLSLQIHLYTCVSFSLGHIPRMFIFLCKEVNSLFYNWTVYAVNHMHNFNKVEKMREIFLSSVQFSHLACPTLCDPMDCSTPDLPVHHQLPEFTQTHVHRVGDAIQPSHPLLSPSSPLNLSQHQGLFKWVSSSHQVAKILEFQLQHQSFYIMLNLYRYRQKQLWHLFYLVDDKFILTSIVTFTSISGH